MRTHSTHYATLTGGVEITHSSDLDSIFLLQELLGLFTFMKF